MMNEIILNILLLVITFIYLTLLITNKISHIIFSVFLIFLLTSSAFFLMGLKFIGVLYLIIYAGAVIILMLISAQIIDISQHIKTSLKNILLLFSSLIFIAIVGFTFLKLPSKQIPLSTYTYSVSEIMFNENFLSVEFISLILIAAIAGIINFLKRSDDEI